MGDFWMVRRGWKKEIWRSKDLSSGKRRRTEGNCRIDKKHLDGKHGEKWIWTYDLNLDLNDLLIFSYILRPDQESFWLDFKIGSYYVLKYHLVFLSH